MKKTFSQMSESQRTNEIGELTNALREVADAWQIPESQLLEMVRRELAPQPTTSPEKLQRVVKVKLAPGVKRSDAKATAAHTLENMKTNPLSQSLAELRDSAQALERQVCGSSQEPDDKLPVTRGMTFDEQSRQFVQTVKVNGAGLAANTLRKMRGAVRR